MDEIKEQVKLSKLQREKQDAQHPRMESIRTFWILLLKLALSVSPVSGPFLAQPQDRSLESRTEDQPHIPLGAVDLPAFDLAGICK